MIDIYKFYFNNNKVELKYLNKNGPNFKIGIHGICKDFPFHPIDHVYFGHIQDLLELFSIEYDKTIPPIETANLFNNVIRSEIYITIPYISNFDTRVSNYIKDPLSYLVDNGSKRTDAIITSRELMDKISNDFMYGCDNNISFISLYAALMPCSHPISYIYKFATTLSLSHIFFTAKSA